MKIALVRTASNRLGIGAYNIQEIGLARSLLKHDIAVDFYSCFSNVPEPVVHINKGGLLRVKIIPLKGVKFYKEIVLYPRLPLMLKNGGYAAVLLEDDSQVMLPYLFRMLKKRGVKTILWQGMYRNFDRKGARLYQRVFDLIFKSLIKNNADIKLAKTNYAKQYLIRKGYTNVHLLKVGLDVVPEELDESLDVKISDFSSQKKRIMLYVGVFNSRRDLLFIIDVLRRLGENTGLILIGDGPSHPFVLQYIKDNNLQQSVFAFKFVENSKMHIVYKYVDVFLLPTKYEIYGMVILEALKYGVPVVSTKEAGPLTILNDRILGVCLELDVDAWVTEILFYCARSNRLEDKQYRADWIKKEYDWDIIAKLLLSYIS